MQAIMIKWWIIKLLKTLCSCTSSLEIKINQWNVHCFTLVSTKTAQMTKLRAFLQTLQQHHEQKSTRVIYLFTFRHWLNSRKCHNWWTQLILNKYYNFPISTRRNNVIFGVVMTLFLASCVRWVEEHGSGKGPPRVVNIWNVCDLIRMTYQLTMLTGVVYVIWMRYYIEVCHPDDLKRNLLCVIRFRYWIGDKSHGWDTTSRWVNRMT